MSTRHFSIATVFAVLLTLLSAAPASAELVEQPTTWWGVDTLATGTQTDSIQSHVFAIEQVGDRVFVGGRFLDVAHENNRFSRPFLAAYDANTGIWIDTFTPDLNGAVYALEAAPDGSALFVGGEFTQVFGNNVPGLVSLDPQTGAISNGWTTRIQGGAPANVRALDLEGDHLYIAGSFNTIVSDVGTDSVWRAARIDWATGDHDPNWRPVVQGGSVWGIAASPDADRVYLAGYFTTVNGDVSVGGFHPVAQTSGATVTGVQPFEVNTLNVSRQYLYDVEVANGIVWAVGSEHFVQALNEADLSLRYFHLSDPKGDYQDLEIVGDRVYAGCHCRQDATLYTGLAPMFFPFDGQGFFASQDNSWISAFDANTGLAVPGFDFNITANRAGVWAIHGAPDGCVWIGGDVTGTGGIGQNSLTRVCDPDLVDDERPSTPRGMDAVSIGGGSVSLEWLASTDNTAVAGYKIYDGATGDLLLTTSGLGTTAQIDGLVIGETYSYYVKAFDAAQNTSWRSNIDTVVVTNGAVDEERPSTPTGLTLAGVGSGSVSLSWNPSNDNVGIAGYQVFDASDNALLAEVGPTPSATVTGLVNGQSIGLYVKAFDAAGNTSWRTNTVTATPSGNAVDTERPTPPKGLQGSAATATTASLTWTASTDDVGVTGYIIYDAATDGAIQTVSGTSATITGLVSGSTSTFYVKAVDAAGNTSWRSNTRTVTQP